MSGAAGEEIGSGKQPIFLSSDTESEDFEKQPPTPKKKKLSREQLKRKWAHQERRDEDTQTNSSSFR